MMSALLENPLTLLLAQAALIVLLSRSVGLLARRLGQPMVVAEILAGIVLGPSLFGWLLPAASAALFPSSSLPTLGLLSELGLLLFMFLIGLELDPRLLRGRAQSSVAISHSSIVLPFALGGVLALFLHPRLAPAGVPQSSFVLFMGVAMSITAFPVLARILVERRLVRSRVGAIAIACAAVDDVSAWCILAFVVSAVRSASIGGAVLTLILAIVYIAAMLFVVRPFLKRLTDRTRLGLSQNLVAAIVVLLLLSSWMTELIGIHALFGAFLFGAILPKRGTFAAALAEKLEDVVVILLLPLFFAYSGLRTQIGLLDKPETWLLCLLVIVVACAGKFGGAFIAARLTRLPWREASAIGILMNTRGLMELIVLNIGLDLGVISPTLFAMLVLMALVTTFMTTPLLELVYPLSELARQLAKPEAPAAPAEPQPGFTALVCVSNEKSGPGLCTMAAAIAGMNDSRSRVYALRLLPPTERASFVLEQHDETATTNDEEEAGLAPLLDRAKELSLDVRPLSFVSNTPAEDICDVAEVKRADLVLLGWHKPLLGNTMLSGTVHDVMSSASANVGVLVDRGLDRIRRVLVPYLGSEHDQASLQLAKRIGEGVGATITILHVVTPEREAGSLGAQERMQQDFAETDGSRRYDVVFKAVPHPQPAEAVIEESARGYDLVLIGVGKEWGLEHRSFGRKSETILARSTISVLVVRRGVQAEAARASQPDGSLEPAAEPS
jgi:Kef-type K+ transport system membrane component KefB/nucleotide-binding universal stress UspA family protein